MKLKMIVAIVLLFSFIGAGAYEVDGDLEVKWTGFKTEKKVGVSGTFNDIKLNIKKSSNFAQFLKSAKVKIASASLESGLVSRNNSIVSTLFSLSTSKEITGTISKVNSANKTLTLSLIMNKVAKKVPMTYVVKDSKIVAKGKIDILSFDMKKPFELFAKECFTLHEGKSYTDVNIEFTLPYKN